MLTGVPQKTINALLAILHLGSATSTMTRVSALVTSFANPIQVASTGAETTASIYEAHRTLCDQASSLSDMVRQGQASKTRMDRCGSENDNLLPLCRAILIIPDGIWDVPKCRRQDDFDTEVQRQNVLIVLIADDDGRYAPIDLERY